MDCANCKWTLHTHNDARLSSVTCGDFVLKVAERNARVNVDPDRCERCNEAITPRATKGSIKCKCDQPRAPQWAIEESNNKPLSGQVRYGGR